MKNKKCKILKKFDLFSLPFNFTYEKEDKYSTRIGGVFTILFVLVIVVYLIIQFIPFAKRDNYDLVYLEENKDQTDILELKKSKNDLAYRLEYKNNYNSGFTCEDLLDVQINHLYSEKDEISGKRNKTYTNINTYDCNIKKFINVNKSHESVYKCLNQPDKPIRNVYNDNNFTYYEIIVSLKDSQKDNFTNINNYLLSNDCKFELYYLDYTINVENYSNPIKSYRNSAFLQLSPVSILEMNIYFMKQFLEDKGNIIFNTDKEKTRENTIFSRIEQYSYYKGENRTERKIKYNDPDYNIYAKIFIRADTKVLKVKRNYQTLGGFWADNTSIFFDVFTLCSFLIGFVYDFLSYHFLSKKIFYFIGVENNFNYFPNDLRLKKLIKKMDNVQDVQIPKEETNHSNSDIKISMNTYKKKNEDSLRKENTDDSHVNCGIKNTITEDNILKSKKDEFSFGKKKTYNRCCNFCIYRKNFLKANEIIKDKLDVVLYIRNTILLDIISKTVICDERANIVKFLSIPLVSLKNENEKNTKLYSKYTNEDFENCEKEVINSVDKKEKTELEKKLILYTKKKIEEFQKLN